MDEAAKKATRKPAGAPLRYRRFGGGYRREDVEAALAELREALAKLDEELGALRARAAELERELDAARAEVSAYRRREEELTGLIGRAEAVLRRIGALEEETGEGHLSQ